MQDGPNADVGVGDSSANEELAAVVVQDLEIQGDTSRWSKSPVDTKTKVML